MRVLQSPFGIFCPDKYSFPHPSTADEDGLVAIGGDLEPGRLIAAYSQGIFPWFIDNGYVFWYSPDPRAVLYPQDFRLHKSLAKSIKKQNFEFYINKNFRGVIEACAAGETRKGAGGTWISEAFIEAYVKLHQIGFAQSVECYKNKELVGGLYGVKLGGVFFGESMFYKTTDASKAALWFLCDNAKQLGVNIIDCQQYTPHLASMGAIEIDRKEFLEKIKNEIGDK